MVSTHLRYYTAICQERLRHHKRSQSGWLVTQVLFKYRAWKLQVRNITTCASCLVDIRQVFGKSNVLFAFLALCLRPVASLISQLLNVIGILQIERYHSSWLCWQRGHFNIALTLHIASAHIWVLKPPGLYQPLDNLKLTHSAE